MGVPGTAVRQTGEAAMGYRIRTGEPVAEATRRIACEQLDKAVDELADRDMDVHERVHQARKRFKKIRALLRLVRPALGETYSSENDWFRDVAGELSRVRDASALVETLDSLGETYGDQADEAFLNRVRTTMVRRRDELAQSDADVEATVGDLVAVLDGARDRVDGWTLEAEGFEALGPGLAKTYARGRAAVATVDASPTEENVHELRKRSKYHRYHVQLLTPLWPTVLDSLLTATHDLTDLLGEHQNLHVLRETLHGERELLDRGRDTQVLLGILDRRQAELRGLAQPLARRVFAEKPKAFTTRFGVYWQAWTRQGQPAPDS
jgi:CHAD domain-containing protein